MKTILEDLDDMYFLAGLTENVFVQAKISRIKKDFIKIVESCPNDAELGAQMRKML